MGYKSPQGQSITQVVQNVVSMFRDARMNDMTPDDNLQIILLNIVKDPVMMSRLQEQIHEFRSAEDVKRAIFALDRAKSLTPSYTGSVAGNTVYALQETN